MHNGSFQGSNIVITLDILLATGNFNKPIKRISKLEYIYYY